MRSVHDRLRQQLIEVITGFKLYGMRASFDEIASKGLNRRDELYPLQASLIRAELNNRDAHSIYHRISVVRFPVLKNIDAFRIADAPVGAGLARKLATGSFLDGCRNVSLIGGTGPGKTHLAMAPPRP